MSLSHLILLYAGSLFAAYVLWHGCGLIANNGMRGLLRSAVVALLCTPGFAVGHGAMVIPSLFGLFVQPLFTLLPVGIGWLLALVITFTGQGRRNPPSRWPGVDALLRFSPAKLVLFGVIFALVFVALQQGSTRDIWLTVARYIVFFAGAGFNLTVAQRAASTDGGNAYLPGIWFAAPALILASPVVGLFWYVAGVVGRLRANGKRAAADKVWLAVFTLLAVSSAWRVYLAATAAAHVTIGGGVLGNAAFAAGYLILALLPWWWSRLKA